MILPPRATVALTLALLSSASGCQAPSPTPQRGALAGAIVEHSGPLWVLFPELDQRLARVYPKSGRADMMLFADLWHPDVHAVRDFIVDRRLLLALLGSRVPGVRRQLFAVELPAAPPARGTPPVQVRQLTLPPAPIRLFWADGRRVLVGHGTPHHGPPGRLTIVATDPLRVVRSIELAGACTSLAAAGDRAFVVERIARRGGAGDDFLAYQLAEVDLARYRVARRMALPAGARQLAIGPSGLLYVAQQSGAGDAATDGTLTVIDPGDWAVVARLRLGLVVRRMAATRQHLVLSMLSTSGKASFGVMLDDHETLFDFDFPELVGRELAVVDGVAYLPLRRGARLERIALGRKERPDPLPLRAGLPPDDAYADRPTLLRPQRSW